jgi:hypothetical protein
MRDICDSYSVGYIQHGQWYSACYGIPGLQLSVRGSPNKDPKEATIVAADALCDHLNARTKHSTVYGRRVMGGAELAVALANLDIGPSQFAIIVGTPQSRVMDWIGGKAAVPHTIYLIVSVMARDGHTERFRALTDAAMAHEGGATVGAPEHQETV